MKQRFFVIGLLAILTMASCNTPKKNSNMPTTDITQPKANLLDGEWEPDFIMNSPKPFQELYSQKKPSITFNTNDGKVSGNTGCNQFNGSFKVDGNQISWNEAGMATTRKMCIDMAGEETFLNTLKKANRYSVTEAGKTLNLIMGDIAVMRLKRK